MRKEIERYPRPDGREEQSGGIEPTQRKIDHWSNPEGHEIFSPSPSDTDPMARFTVPDCAYKGYDTFTWPEGKADPCDLPCDLKHLNMPDDSGDSHGRTKQDDDYESMKPSKG